MYSLKMFFGRRTPNGGTVTNGDFISFCTNYIDPELPGYTLTNGGGRWEGQTEPVWVLEAIGERDEVLMAQASSISQLYCSKFDQSLVLCTIAKLKHVAFVGAVNAPEPELITDHFGTAAE